MSANIVDFARSTDKSCSKVCVQASLPSFSQRDINECSDWILTYFLFFNVNKSFNLKGTTLNASGTVFMVYNEVLAHKNQPALWFCFRSLYLSRSNLCERMVR